MVPVSKTLKTSVDLLSLFRQLDFHQQLSYSHIHRVTKETKASHITAKNGLREGITAFREYAGHDTSADRLLEADEVLRRRIILMSLWQDYRLSGQLHGVVL